MSILPQHLLYTDTHLWLYVDQEGFITLGLTDFAQESIGSVVEVYLPEIGSEITQDSELMSLAGERDHFELMAPIAGEIIAVNDALADMPILVNQEPYDDGWLLKLSPLDSEELDELLSDEEYAQLIQY